jgi:glyoxylate reductase
MSRPVVLLARRLPSSVQALLREHVDLDVHDEPRDLTPEELRARVAGKQALVSLVTTRVDEALLDAAAGLRIVANVAVGYDNIDVAAATRRGIVVTNTPDVLTGAVADFTMALILAVSRRLVEGERLVRAGGWKGWALDFMLGTELSGKQLGIIGYGRIGRAVAQRAEAFGMRVVRAAHGAPPARVVSPAGPAGGAADPRLEMTLDELLVSSDVVTLHVPMSGETRHLMDQRRLTRMKRTAYLVNTSRGPVVDEAALAWALRERRIAGAALDVYEREPIVHPELLGLENVVLAPHLGSATTETRTAMAELAARNVIEVLAGRQPLTEVQGPRRREP